MVCCYHLLFAMCAYSLSLSLCVSLVTKSWCFSGMIIPQEITRRAWDRKRGRGSVRSSPAFLVDLDFLDASDLSFFSDLSWPGNSSNSGTHREPLKNNTINAEESNKKNRWISRKESGHIISTLPVKRMTGTGNRKGAPSPCDFPVPPAPWRANV